MIVLDEQLKHANLEEQLAKWYRGRILNITALRPGTVIKDDAVPLLLQKVSDPTFITINTTDFWEQVQTNRGYCIVCFPLTDDRVDEIPNLLRQLFRLQEFCTKQARRGKIARVSHRQIRYYEHPSFEVHSLAWNEE